MKQNLQVLTLQETENSEIKKIQTFTCLQSKTNFLKNELFFYVLSKGGLQETFQFVC